MDTQDAYLQDAGTALVIFFEYSCLNYLVNSKIVGYFAQITDLIFVNNCLMNIVNNIRTEVCEANPGTIFFNSDFQQYDEEYVGKVLADLNRDGTIIRLSRGVYLKAEKTRFGLVYPPVEAIAKAIARRDNAEIIPCGDTVLHMLGFSTQVPMKYVFVTTGSARQIKVGNYTISFKRGTPKNFAIKGKVTRLIVQAMKSIGEANFDNNDDAHLQSLLLKYNEKDTIQEDLKAMPQWIKRRIVKHINSSKHDQ